MSYKAAFRDVMRDYELDRNRAAALLRSRQEEVYRKLPRVKEIEQELAKLGIGAAKQILADGADEADGTGRTADSADSDVTDGTNKNVQERHIRHIRHIKNLQDSTRSLKTEKERLLTEAGIPKGYFVDIHRCRSCQDTGYIEGNRCKCLNQRLIEKYYDLSNLRGQLEAENFNTFELRYYSNKLDPLRGLSPYRNMELIYKEILNFVKSFGKADEEFQNLLFYGAPGLGKTFLCNCIAKEILDAGHTVLYMTAPQISKLVEDYRFNRQEMENPEFAMDAVTDVDLLIIDDLGAEFDTIVTSAALFNIINQRLLAKKSTVISTNLPPEELETQYSDRMVSRFWGNYKISKFIGDDIRAKKAIGG